MRSSDGPLTANLRVDDTVIQVPTDDKALATLLSHSHSKDEQDLINAVSPSRTQQSQTVSELRHRTGASDNSKVPAFDTAATPSQLARLIKDSPFIDVHSPMTAYEWFKVLALMPWSIFRIAVGLPCTLLVWGVVALLVWGNPINTPLPRWRRAIMSGWIKYAAPPCAYSSHPYAHASKAFLFHAAEQTLCMFSSSVCHINVRRFWATLLISLGLNFFTLRVKGRQHIAQAHRVRPIIIFNHVSYLDGIVMAAIFAPSGIAKASVANMPFFGVCTRALQFLFILRRGTTDEQNPHIYNGRPAEKIAERAVDAR